MTTNEEPAITVKRAATPDEIIHSLQVALTKTERNTSQIADLVRHVLEDQHWGEFHSFTGVTRTHESFREFVTAPRYEGLGMTREGLLAVLRLEDEALADEVERAWMEDISPAGSHGGSRKADSAAPAIPLPAQQSVDGVLRRLKRDHPALADEVIQGTITATAAARKAGYQTPVVRLGKIETVAKKLADHYTPEELAELKNLI